MAICGAELKGRRVEHGGARDKAPQNTPCPQSIYYLHPAVAGSHDAWKKLLMHAAGLGFDAVLLASPWRGVVRHTARDAGSDRHDSAEDGTDALAAIETFARRAHAAGLAPLLDLELRALYPAEEAIADHSLLNVVTTDSAHLRFLDPEGPLVGWWDSWISAVQAVGIEGFHCLDAHQFSARVWRRLTTSAQVRDPRVSFIASTWGATPSAVASLIDAGFDLTVSSSCFWDFRAPWIDEDHDRIAAVAPAIAMAMAPTREAAVDWDDPHHAAEWRRALRFAGSLGHGWILPMGVEFGRLRDFSRFSTPSTDVMGLLENATGCLCGDVAAINASRRKYAALYVGPLRRVSAPWADVAIFSRGTQQRPGITIAVNACADRAVEFDPVLMLRGCDYGGSIVALDSHGNMVSSHPSGETEMPLLACRHTLEAAEALVARLILWSPSTQRSSSHTVQTALSVPRIAIEHVTPAVPGGSFAVKRVVGERVVVEADVICDGHDRLAADLLFRAENETAWQRSEMRPLGNDRWQGQFPLTRLGRHIFAIEAWHDRFGSFVEEIGKKYEAGVDITLELAEGMALCAAVAAHADGESGILLKSLVADLEQMEDQEKRERLLDPATVAVMRAHEERRFLSRFEPPGGVDADRPAALFANWYEVFPRSQSFDENRHGNFRDVIAQLPRIRAMGFDILYFPPIHPIGRTNRKGPNNTLKAGSKDPGSPYAIGAEEGGHDALHPELGTLEDFQELLDAAAQHGIEIALDFAIQCSPDHPWLREHPEWFHWRPDGSIKHAENPPKKYEDIVNVDFYSDGSKPSLWKALRDIVLFWAGQGVRTFRVDNPHTKPLPFWEWLIVEVRGRYPGTIFLAEAFTRPKLMYRLAKIGFSQSYTYFTWRNSAAELRDYIEELVNEPARDFFRPNFFVNTPDINPFFLQNSGRAGFLIRAALAATLSGLWGIYNGFEVCEADSIQDREEYRDSEKYQLRRWDLDRPGNIIQEITTLNQVRRRNPALQDHRGVRFLNVDDPDLLFYRKSNADGTNIVFVVVSMVVDRTIETEIDLPLCELGLRDDDTLHAEDLMRGVAFSWHGRRQYVRLDPAELPFCIWRVRK